MDSTLKVAFLQIYTARQTSFQNVDLGCCQLFQFYQNKAIVQISGLSYTEHKTDLT